MESPKSMQEILTKLSKNRSKFQPVPHLRSAGGWERNVLRKQKGKDRRRRCKCCSQDKINGKRSLWIARNWVWPCIPVLPTGHSLKAADHALPQATETLGKQRTLESGKLRQWATVAPHCALQTQKLESTTGNIKLGSLSLRSWFIKLMAYLR